MNQELPGVTDQVRDFYERYPYPRPIESLETYRRHWQDPPRRRADFHLFWPSRPYREDFSILVAGCGTSQAAKHAVRWPDARVVGIDFSASSVRSTAELKRKHGLNNLQLHALPLERVGELGLTFDQIVCTGVLHHLADPDAGLRALCNVLEPDGAMYLMLYAPYGRTGIYMLQEFCRRIGLQGASADEIRDLITLLTCLPPGHPLEHLLREAPDFKQEAALADALLHPQDRAYSVPQLFELIDKAGLTFGRWVRQAPYSPQCGVVAKLPQATRLVRLSSAEQYAAVELFRGTMVRHNLIAHRRGYAGKSLSFSGDAWPGYVPIRMSDTICVQERLPPGAAGVLINRLHSYTDLFLPIDAAEKRLLDGVDGTRCIADILERARPTSTAVARSFFERLCCYDQVILAT